MTLHHPELIIESNVESLYVQCLEPTPDAPTFNVSVGNDITVEIDFARPQAPVSVTIHDVAAAAINLCDLFGTATAHELVRLHSDITEAKPLLTFSPGPGWQGLVAAAYQQWIIFWNPLPLDGALHALDTVAAADQNLSFDGARTVRQHADAALPAARTLQRLLEAGEISELAVTPVRAAIEALNRALLPGVMEPSTAYTIPLPLPETDLSSILDDTKAVAVEEPEVRLTGSPDWRLSGLGAVTTAEDTIRVQTHTKNPHAITITVPLAIGNPAATLDGYEAFITEPSTGLLIAHTRLKLSTDRILRGHCLPVRPIGPTDHVDIRHESLQARPETNPQQRSIDRSKRNSARRLVRERLKQIRDRGPLQTTLMELAHAGQLLAHNHDEQLINDLEILLFTLARETTSASAVRSSGKATSREWDEYVSTSTGAKVYVDDRGEYLRIWLENFEHQGQIHLDIVVSATFITPVGFQTAESDPTTISTRRPNHYVNVSKPYPRAAVDHIQVRISLTPGD
ncbi:hypothetical protein [Arthrobacter sp. MAHUQ-56]